MRIVQINASYKPAYIYGGPTMSVSKLSEELVKAGKNVEVLTTTANGDTELDVKFGESTIVDGVIVTYFHRITGGNSHLSPALLFSLWKTLNKMEKPRKPSLGVLQDKFSNPQVIQTTNISDSHIVHIHTWWNLVSVGSCLIALAASKPVLLSSRGTLSKYSFKNRKSIIKNIFHLFFGKSLLRRCHFHATTEKEKEDILRLITPKTITVIPNFVNLEAGDNKSNSANLNSPFLTSKATTSNLLFLSRIEEKKGLDILFRALFKGNFNYHLTIAGTGELEYISYLKSLACELNLQGNITWVGQQDNKEKFTVLAAHDIMILPSHDESFANIVIESLSVGTPVLISSNVGLADYVLTNRFGWVYNNKNELSHIIKRACNDMKQQQFINRTAPKQIRNDYDDKKLIIQYTAMYNKIFNWQSD